ncbi:hypothetical protein KI387_028945, partial [Taxus chinensis]
MSMDRISAAAPRSKKRKGTQEDVGFPPALKPIITARRSRLLLCTEDSTNNYRDCEQDITCHGNNEENNNVEGNEGCHTPKGEEHQIPRILSCPPAPKKPRQAARRKSWDNCLCFNSVELNLFFNFSPKKSDQ